MVLRLRLRAFAQEDRALERLRNLGARQAQPGFGHVHETHHAIDGHAGLLGRPQMLVLVRDTNDQRAMRPAGIQEPLAARHHAAVVRAVDDNRVLVEAVLLQGIQRLLDVVVHVLHGIGVLGVTLADGGQVGMIGVQLHLVWIVPRMVGIAVGAAFMTAGRVHHGEERLARLALAPPEALLPVQEIPAVTVRPAADVVVRLGPVRRMISRLPQQVGIVLDHVMRNLVPAAHGLRSVGDGIHTGNPGGARGSTDGGVVKAMEIPKSLGRQLVDVGRLAVRSAVATDPEDAVVLAGQPENVGAALSVARAGPAAAESQQAARRRNRTGLQKLSSRKLHSLCHVYAPECSALVHVPF